MRQPVDWDEEYILALPVGEHSNIEAKGRRTIDLTLPGVKEAEGLATLSKSVSAFANSGGGVLLLGVKENTTSWEIDDGGVALVVKGKTSTREWLEDVLSKLVEEPLVDFDVHVVLGERAGSQIAEGRGVFVIEIRDSERAPHQANDKRYYARVAGKSQPIGHRFVTDIFNRRRHPKLELSVKFHIVRERELSEKEVLDIVSAKPSRSGHEWNEYETKEVLEARFQVRNVGKVLVDYMHCRVWIPTGMMSPGSIRRDEVEQIDDVDYMVWTTDNMERDLIKDSATETEEAEYGPSWYKRILPGMNRSWVWGDGALRVDMVNAYSNNHIIWEILADNAPVERGIIKIGDIKQVFERGVRLR